jgi:hypothetical protein
MVINNSRKKAYFVLVAIAVSLTSTESRAQAVNPAAEQILQRMTAYISELPKFSVHTQITLEDLLDSGQRIDLDVAARTTVRRPNKIHAERVGELFKQSFYYDGESLTLHNPSDQVYSTQPAPGTIEEALDVTRETLGIIMPVSDLVYRNVHAILMQDVISATVIGKADIGGVTCDHVAVRRPDVDFQVWVADGDSPLPCKYVVTDTSTPEMVSTVTVMSDWNLNPSADDAEFKFVPPDGAESIIFVPYDSGSTQ